MNRHDTNETTEATSDVQRHDGTAQGPGRLVSRVRAVANAVFLVTGLAFLLGFLLVIGGVGTFTIYTLDHIVLVLRYIGLVAAAAFITSVISIIIENRTTPRPGQEEET